VHRHIDLFELSPGRSSLKDYAARMHHRSMQEYAGSFDAPADDIAAVREYCHHDLLVTEELARRLEPEIQARRDFDVAYEGLSEPKIAQTILAKGERGPCKPMESTFRYVPPAWLPRDLPVMDKFTSATFGVRETGHVVMPVDLVGMSHGPYQFGIGGLHSTESARTLREPLVDLDVASYYPALLLESGRFRYEDVYREVRDMRLRAKHEGRDAEAAVFKIVLNSSYGLLGNMYSPLYDPPLQMYVTLTGQLALLYLIELLERKGNAVVSANTDGVTLRPSGDWRGAVDKWQRQTGLTLEETHYVALFSRDVNSYVAVKPNGQLKRKGFFGVPSLRKNPAADIATEAAIQWLVHGVDIEQTVRGCSDIRQFLLTRKVAGGAHLDGVPLGKVVRWYWSVAEPSQIRYLTNNNRVSLSDGGRPVIDLPSDLPVDIDYTRYIERAREIVKDVGS
jgi:hypothetical protein